MILLLYLVLFALGLYLSCYVLYTLALVLIHFFHKEKVRLAREPKTRFMVIIPAHNEELMLGSLLESLSQQDYPSSMIGLVIVADNCSDDTAAIGQRHGALVLERHDPVRHGKGYAIKYGLDNSKISEYDAVFIIDADSVVKTDTLRRLDLAIQDGARIIQCYNGLANPNESWFTRLMDVSRTLGNEVLEPAKEKIGFSSHLMGNGMCFVRDIISKYGWDAFTVGEDWEYYAKVVGQGERVAFAQNVRVYHQESKALKQATSQRMRWSSGRMAVAYRYGLRLFLKGLMEMDVRKIDASFPLIFPNPSMTVNLNLLLLTMSILSGYTLLICWFFAALIPQFFLFCVGIMYTKNRIQKLLAVFMAPTFLAWKMVIDLFSLVGCGRRKWVRTQRKI